MTDADRRPGAIDMPAYVGTLEYLTPTPMYRGIWMWTHPETREPWLITAVYSERGRTIKGEDAVARSVAEIVDDLAARRARWSRLGHPEARDQFTRCVWWRGKSHV